MNVRADDRARLAQVLDRFLTGETTVAQFASEVRQSLHSTDAGVSHIAEALWDSPDLDSPAYQNGTHPKLRQLTKRCRQFLGTDLPYEWPEPPPALLIDLVGAGLIAVIMAAVGHILFAWAIGAIGAWTGDVVLVINAIILWIGCSGALAGAAISRGVVRQHQLAAQQRLDLAGARDVWPFLRYADYARAGVPTMPAHIS
jgi:hypothetical protein